MLTFWEEAALRSRSHIMKVNKNKLSIWLTFECVRSILHGVRQLVTVQLQHLQPTQLKNNEL